VRGGIDIRVNIAGLALDDAALVALPGDWARLGNGLSIDAQDEAGLAAVVVAGQPTFDVLDASGTVVARGQVGGEAMALPPGTYVVEVRTDPAQTIEAVEVRPGEETTVDLASDPSTAVLWAGRPPPVWSG